MRGKKTGAASLNAAPNALAAAIAANSTRITATQPCTMFTRVLSIVSAVVITFELAW